MREHYIEVPARSVKVGETIVYEKSNKMVMGEIEDITYMKDSNNFVYALYIKLFDHETVIYVYILEPIKLLIEE